MSAKQCFVVGGSGDDADFGEAAHAMLEADRKPEPEAQALDRHGGGEKDPGAGNVDVYISIFTDSKP